MLTRKSTSSNRRGCCVILLRAAVAMLALSSSLFAQESLTLREAVDLASRSNPLLAATTAGEQQAEARIREARSGFLPRAEISESFQRSNNPVFAFMSLLTQHQLREQDFAGLNRVDASNYQSRLTIEQVLFDAGQTSHAVEEARFFRRLAHEDSRRSQSDVVLQVIRTYFGVELAESDLGVARDSVASAHADLARARAIYDSGRSTNADVLALRVHLAAMLEEEIRASNEVAVCRAELNDVLGVDLERSFELRTPLTSRAATTEGSLEEYRREAAENRAEIRAAELTEYVAHSQQQIAVSRYWPKVVGQGIVEADRQGFANKSHTYWLAGVMFRWNLWNGGETKAQVQQARFAESRAEALRKKIDSAIHLQVRKAYLELQAATQRVQVASAATAEAEEAHRIVQNRYESGLTTVTELLRSESSLAAARMHYLAAAYDHRVAAAVLEHAAGTLTRDSEQLK